MPWVERTEPWHHTEAQYCEVTGQLLPRRYWVFEAEGLLVKACDPRYERLYREYVLKRERRER
jgi:hypothetical protein